MEVHWRSISFNSSCLTKCFLLGLLLLLQGSCPYPGYQASCTKGGNFRPKLEKNSTLYAIRKQKIKQDILEKMGLQETAGVRPTPRNHIPEAILNQFWEESQRYDESERTETSRQVRKLMVHATKAKDENCIGCLHFFHRSTTLQSRLTKSYLWIYQDQSTSRHDKRGYIEVRVAHRKTKTKTLITEKIQIPHKRVGWSKINLKDLDKWTTSTIEGHLQIDLLLQITCTYCKLSENDELLPYLDLSEVSIIKRRTRRSTGCIPGSNTCCLDNFDIQFDDFIGSNFAILVLMPKSINVGQCRGTCDSAHAASDAHSGMVQSALIRSQEKVRMPLCCVPTEYITITALIKNDSDQSIYAQPITNTVVSRCGCA